MRGWRRIGVVLSVLWFIGFGAWRITATDNVSKLYENRLGLCYSTSSIQRDPIRWDDPQRDQKLARVDSEEKACKSRASAQFDEQWDTLKSYAWVIVLIDTASIALFWLLAWIIVYVGRWIGAGFRPPQAG